MDISLAEAEALTGSLPRVCFKTGRPADSWVEVKVRHVPAWVILVFIFSWPFGILVGLLATQRAAAILPVTGAVRRRLRVAQVSSFALIVSGIVVLVVSLQFASFLSAKDAAVIALSFLGFGITAFLLSPNLAARGRVVNTPGLGRRIVLKGVHPEFAAAVFNAHSGGAIQPTPVR